jgi:hypothetical protein
MSGCDSDAKTHSTAGNDRCVKFFLLKYGHEIYKVSYVHWYGIEDEDCILGNTGFWHCYADYDI